MSILHSLNACRLPPRQPAAACLSCPHIPVGHRLRPALPVARVLGTSRWRRPSTWQAAATTGRHRCVRLHGPARQGYSGKGRVCPKSGAGARGLRNTLPRRHPERRSSGKIVLRQGGRGLRKPARFADAITQAGQAKQARHAGQAGQAGQAGPGMRTRRTRPQRIAAKQPRQGPRRVLAFARSCACRGGGETGGGLILSLRGKGRRRWPPVAPLPCSPALLTSRRRSCTRPRAAAARDRRPGPARRQRAGTRP